MLTKVMIVVKRAIEGVIKAASVSGAKIQQIPYPLDGR